MKIPYGKKNTRRFWIKEQFPLDAFVVLLDQHLQTFRELESLQNLALRAVNSQMPEGLAPLLAKQGEVLSNISREKAELRPFLDQWEGLHSDLRQKLRVGKAESILRDLEIIAHSIQDKHRKMFGEDESSTAQPDLSQTINTYRSFQ